MLQAVLLDRDGVINRERADYVKSWEEFELLPGALDGLSRLASLGIPILVLTNQSAIGRGLVALETVKEIHSRLQEVVTAAGGRLDGFYICPHHPDDGCACRKPKPGLLLQAAAEFNFDLAAAIFVGDSITDYQAAEAAGCPSLLVASGRQASLLAARLVRDPGMTLVPNLAAAVSVLLDEPADGLAAVDRLTEEIAPDISH
jgi:D-glycero-D-manno-heptose 1,7-bisphosphate phosphatase